MTFAELILLAVSLCFDTFAVCISSGICLPQIPRLNFAKIVFTFGFIQALFTLAGWIAGRSFLQLISSFDHWIAFLLLLYLGVKMIRESLSSKDSDVCIDLRNTKVLLGSAVATSIDAVAAGVTLAFVGISQAKIFGGVITIGVITILSATIGIKWGRRIGNKIGKRSEMAGGVILILLGLKILADHLDFLY